MESLVSVGMTTAVNAIVQNVSRNVAVGALNLFVGQLVAANFLADYGQHGVNSRNGIVPDGFMITSQVQGNLSVIGGSVEGGIYVDIDDLFADGVFYTYGAVGVSLGPTSRRGGSIGAALGLTFNTFDPMIGKNDPTRLNGYAFNATWPLPLANVILKANPALASLKAAGTFLPILQHGGVSLSVSAKGLLEPNFDSAAVISYTSNGISNGLSTGASRSWGFASPIPIGQFASFVGRTGFAGAITMGQIMSAAVQARNEENR